MADITAPQRALHAYLLAYRGQGIPQAAVATMTLAECSDLGRLVEAGLVELRFVPVIRIEDDPVSIAEEIDVEGKRTLVGEPAQLEPDPPADRDTRNDVPVEPASPPPTAKRPSASMPKPDTKAGGFDQLGRMTTFLKALQAGGTIKAALVAIGLGPNSNAWVRSARAGDAEFNAAVKEALEAARAKREAGRPFAPAPDSSDDVELDGAQGRALPGGTGDNGDDPLSQRDADRPDRGGPAPVAGVAAGDREQPVRHHGVASGLSREEIARQALAHEAEQRRIAELRPPMTAEEAQIILQRAGWAVYRASVVGGRADRWAINGVGKDLTDGDLIERAERAQERKAAA